MNEFTLIERPFSDVRRDAVEECNSWRGRCINLFARAEGVVTQALRSGPKSQKFELLGKRVSQLEHQFASRPEILALVERLREFFDLRNVIVHCEARVLIDFDGNWEAEFRDAVGGVQVRISKEDAEVRRRGLQSTIDRLQSQLKAVD